MLGCEVLMKGFNNQICNKLLDNKVKKSNQSNRFFSQPGNSKSILKRDYIALGDN